MTGPALRIGFIGAGRTANALARALADAGYAVVAVASRTRASAETLAARLPAARAVASPQAVVDACDLVFLTTPDVALRDVVESLRWREGVAVVHTSGAESRALLAVAAEQGASTGSLHPLQTFADRDQAPGLAGTVFAVEAEGDLRLLLLKIVAALGGTPIELRAEDKALYHASAVLMSNYVVTLSKLASDLWLRFGWERPAAIKALAPLLRGAVTNIESLGVPAALTGPVARGDVETVRRHVEALFQAAPEVLPAYRALALETIPVALAKGDLTDEAANALRHVLMPERATLLEGKKAAE
jgi:predicted short-subunit dehydrogenase-like oxidoreductase (DUF2520 family)